LKQNTRCKLLKIRRLRVLQFGGETLYFSVGSRVTEIGNALGFGIPQGSGFRGTKNALFASKLM
jgi:hypothetical protein